MNESKVIMTLMEYDELVARGYKRVFSKYVDSHGAVYLSDSTDDTFSHLKEEIENVRASGKAESARKERDHERKEEKSTLRIEGLHQVITDLETRISILKDSLETSEERFAELTIWEFLKWRRSVRK